MTRSIRGRIILAVTMAVMSFALAGCRGGGSDPIDPPAAAQEILTSLIFRDELLFAEEHAVDNFYTLDDSIEEYAVYISGTGATAEEIAVFRVKNASDVDAAVAVLNKRLEDQKHAYVDYVPEEMVKLNDAVIATKGTAVIMVVSDDGQAAAVVQKILG